MGDPGSGLQYLKSTPSILKILEIVVLLIGIGTVGHFLEQTDRDYEKKDNLKFFVGAAAAAGLVAIAFFLIFVLGFHKKVKLINWTKAAIGVFVILAILLLISSALLAHAVQYYEDNHWCDLLKRVDADAQCKHLIAGVASGFIAMVLFIADAFIHFRL